jgi:hypothetical protein
MPRSSGCSRRTAGLAAGDRPGCQTTGLPTQKHKEALETAHRLGSLTCPVWDVSSQTLAPPHCGVFSLSPLFEYTDRDLTNMRENGVRSLLVMCHGCRHKVIVNVDMYPGEFRVRDFGSRMVCNKCGMVGADVRPNRKERIR